MKKKIALLMAVVMLFAVTTAGTLAWLKDNTDPVVNTFTVGDINIDLTETFNKDTDNDGENDVWEAKLIPGTTNIPKNPVVTVEAESEACYLFVKMIEEYNTVNDKTVVEYTLNKSGWTALENVEGIYWRQIDAATALAGTSFELITGNVVSINDELTKADFIAMGSNTPTITFQAWAVQSENVANATEAWAIANS